MRTSVSCLAPHIRSRRHHQHLQRKMPSITRTDVCRHEADSTTRTTKPAPVIAISDTCCAPDPSILHQDELRLELLLRVSCFELRSKWLSSALKKLPPNLDPPFSVAVLDRASRLSLVRKVSTVRPVTQRHLPTCNGSCAKDTTAQPNSLR
jgi:hypothetical protein